MALLRVELAVVPHSVWPYPHPRAPLFALFALFALSSCNQQLSAALQESPAWLRMLGGTRLLQQKDMRKQWRARREVREQEKSPQVLKNLQFLILNTLSPPGPHKQKSKFN